LPKSNLKVDMLITILEIISTEEGIFRSNRTRLEEILIDFNNSNFDRESVFRVYTALSEVLQSNKSFDFLNRLNGKIYQLISENLGEASKKLELLRIYFYLLFNKLSSNFNNDLSILKTSLSNSSQESKFVEAIVNNNLQGVKELDTAYFNSTYGTGKS